MIHSIAYSKGCDELINNVLVSTSKLLSRPVFFLMYFSNKMRCLPKLFFFFYFLSPLSSHMHDSLHISITLLCSFSSTTSLNLIHITKFCYYYYAIVWIKNTKTCGTKIKSSSTYHLGNDGQIGTTKSKFWGYTKDICGENIRITKSKWLHLVQFTFNQFLMIYRGCTQC